MSNDTKQLIEIKDVINRPWLRITWDNNEVSCEHEHMFYLTWNGWSTWLYKKPKPWKF